MLQNHHRPVRVRTHSQHQSQNRHLGREKMRESCGCRKQMGSFYFVTISFWAPTLSSVSFLVPPTPRWGRQLGLGESAGPSRGAGLGLGTGAPIVLQAHGSGLHSARELKNFLAEPPTRGSLWSPGFRGSSCFPDSETRSSPGPSRARGPPSHTHCSNRGLLPMPSLVPRAEVSWGRHLEGLVFKVPPPGLWPTSKLTCV